MESTKNAQDVKKNRLRRGASGVPIVHWPEIFEVLFLNVRFSLQNHQKMFKETRKFQPPARSIFIDDENSIQLFEAIRSIDT